MIQLEYDTTRVPYNSGMHNLARIYLTKPGEVTNSTVYSSVPFEILTFPAVRFVDVVNCLREYLCFQDI